MAIWVRAPLITHLCISQTVIGHISGVVLPWRKLERVSLASWSQKGPSVRRGSIFMFCISLFALGIGE